MSNLKKDLEEIIDEHADAVLEARDETNTSRAVELQDEADQKATTQIFNLMESVVRKVIGQDELFEPLPQHIETDDPEILKPIHDTKRDCRNDLRKAQRKTFEDIKSKLIGKE